MLSALRKVVRPVLSQRVSSRASSALSVHKPTEYNNDDTPFEFTKESLEKIDYALSKFPTNYKQSACIPLLYIAQEQGDNWLPLTAMNKVAEVLDMPPIRVYEVASFYTMFNRTPVGKFHIQLCGTTPCMIYGAQDVKKAARDFAGIRDGHENSDDGLFTVSEVECLGACVNAPMVQVNNKEFYEHLTPEIMVNLMKDWKAGKTPKAYNQNHIKTCEGPQGKTTLFEETTNTAFRDLDALKSDLDKAKEEDAADK